MIPAWEKNCVLVADVLAQRHPQILQDLKAILSGHDVTFRVVAGSRDIWIRDAAPVQVTERDFVQFRYRPDYLRNGYEHLITEPKVFEALDFVDGIQSSKRIVDGGNIVGIRGTAILTDKVFNENPRRNRANLERELKRLLGVERLIFIPQEAGDAIGHADGMVQFIDENTLVVNDYTDLDPGFGRRLTSSLERSGFTVELLPYRPELRKIDGIESAVGNFVNFLRIGSVLVVPAYGISEDGKALRQLKRLNPQATVVPLACRKLAQEGGALHCATWTIRLPKSRRNRRTPNSKQDSETNGTVAMGVARKGSIDAPEEL